MRFCLKCVAAVALILAATTPCLASGPQGALVLIGSGKPPKTTPLAPGIFINAGHFAMSADAQPRAFAVTITSVDGNSFSGELEVVHLDADGKLVRMDSKLTGTIAASGIGKTAHGFAINFAPKLTISLLDEPLRSLLTNVTGGLRADGFRLDWKPSSVLVYHEFGEWGSLVRTDKAGHQQMLDQYNEMATDKARLMDFQASSATFLKGQINAYMQATDQLLKSPPAFGQGALIAKAAALYHEQQALLGHGQAGDRAGALRQAKLISMQIGAYNWQERYIGSHQRALWRYWQGRGAAVTELVDNSPCISRTSPSHLRLGAAPACQQGLDSAEDALNKRVNALSKARGNTDATENTMSCITEAAHYAVAPIGVRPISGYCKQALAKLMQPAATTK